METKVQRGSTIFPRLQNLSVAEFHPLFLLQSSLLFMCAQAVFFFEMLAAYFIRDDFKNLYIYFNV